SSMGSVSSLISGHSFHSKHCRASQYKLRKSSHLKKLNRYSDGLLRFGFSQDSAHKAGGSKSSKNEDFFYIKVSQKAHGSQRPDYPALGGGELGVPAGSSGLDFGTPTPQKLMPYPSQLEVVSEKGKAAPRAGGCPGGAHLSPKCSQVPPWGCGLWGSSGKTGAAAGGLCQPLLRGVRIVSNMTRRIWILSFPNSAILNPGKAPHHHQQHPGAEKSVCVRSPIATDESTIQQLEQKLLEREGELQELQSSFEEKEISSCQAYEEKQRRCKEELEGLKQKCNSKLKQSSQKTQRTQQVLHLQVFQLQQEKQQLREELEKLVKEQNLLETKLRSYEKEKTSFAPALEETQWEVCQKSGEISLLKQQLKESQTELTTKTTEILSLKAQLKEVRLKMEGLEMKAQELEASLRTKAMELEVCENELQRKKNESELLREKVNLLEQEILELRSELAVLREQLSEAREGPRPGGDDAQALQGQLERLRAELKAERDNNEQMSCSFQHERQTWKEEKEKVIHYQKQLQQSYLHMYKRNQSLEKMLQQLAAGEDGKEPIELEIPGADVPYEDIIATEI
ncbi:N4B3A protein, partial [Brachypodius atriceps]|nr:N4B3A protein [Brachypodius atriceps]